MAAERFGRQAAAAGPERRTRYGVWALILAAATAVIIGLATMFVLNIPQDAARSLWDFSPYLAAAGALYFAPMLNTVGMGLGIAALVVARDSKTMGVLGIIANAGVTAISGLLIWLILKTGP